MIAPRRGYCRSGLACGVLGVVLVLTTAGIPVASGHSSPAPSMAGAAQTPLPTPQPTPTPPDEPLPRFLTLPFRSTAGMRIEQGWLWVGSGHEPLHGGVDYIRGQVHKASTWKSFPVIAAASGRACAGLDGQPSCGFTGVGNRVVMRHRLNGHWWYTYYGHLRTIDPSIPLNRRSDAKLMRGTFLGAAGYSGDPCCVIHLHFSVFDASYVEWDPYGLYARRGRYPDPAGKNGLRNGPDALWKSDPPRVPPSRSGSAARALVAPSRAARLR